MAVTSAIERLRFNVALARLMEFVPRVRSHRAKLVLVALLAPLAPHLAEELWALLGQVSSVHTSAWPTADRAESESARARIVVQVDGRFRTRIELDRPVAEDEVARAALAAVPVVPSRIVYVPDRLINLVTGAKDD